MTNQPRFKILRNRFLTQIALTGISALALAFALAPSQAQAACTETTAGVVLYCTGADSDVAFTATSTFLATLEGASGFEAALTGTTGPALTIDADGNDGTVNIESGATISSAGGAGTEDGLSLIDAGTVTINQDGTITVGDAAADGIRVTGVGTSLTINDTGNVTGMANGIHVVTAGGVSGGDVTVNVTDATVTGNAAGGTGINIAADGGAVTVNVDSDSTVHATNAGGSHAISITNTTGSTDVTINGTVNSTNAEGLHIDDSGAGDITVTTGGDSSVSGSTTAINVQTLGGDIDVTTNGSVSGTAGVRAAQFLAADAASDVTVNTNGTTTGTAGYGVDAEGWGQSGTVTVDQGVESIIHSTGDGFAAIYASASDGNNDEVAGNVSVSTGSFSSLTAAGDDAAGIFTDAYGDASTITISTGFDSLITVAAGAGNTDVSGIYARARDDNGGGGFTGNGTSGTIDITTGTFSGITVTGDNSSGITAQNDGDTTAGHTDVTTGFDSNIDVTGDTSFGIAAIALKGDVAVELGEDSSVTVEANGAAGTQTISAGVYASSVDGAVVVDSDGGTSVTVSTDGTHESIGVDAISTNSTVDVTVDDVTSNNGRAIVTSAGDTSTITVNGEVQGLGTSGATAVIDITTASGETTTLTNNASGDIHSIGDSASDLAVKGTTGSIIFDNDGELTGRVDFSGLTGVNTVAMTNTTSSWHVSGTNTFGPGADSLVNSGSPDATIYVDDTATFNFGAGSNTFTNGTGGDTGIIDLRTGTGTNSLTLTHVAYTGSASGGTGVLIVDANLGDDGVTANPDSSDKLIINPSAVGGSASTTAGTTFVRVNDLLPKSAASYNPTGILVVDGSTAAGQFVLDPTQANYNASKNALDEGWFDYSLTHSSGDDILVSSPSDEGLEVATLVGAAQEIWQSTSPWQDRQADLRDSMATHSHEINPGVWAKGVGRWTTRDVSQNVTTGGVTTTNNADYDQKTYGGVAGIDGSKELSGNGGRIIVGGQGGYVRSDVDFSTNSAEFTGAIAGAYVTFLKGGFFADGAFKANFLNMDYTAPTLGGSASADVRSYGGEFDAGQRFPLAGLNVGPMGDAFVEPVVSLVYVRTSIDNFTIAGTTVDFKDNESLRAGGGLRAGATVSDTNALKAKVAVTGRVWNEFLGDNKVTLHSAGPDTTVTDTFDGVFGEGGVSLNLFGKGANAGVSGFVNGSVKVGQDYLSPGVTAGARFEW